ncbi:hypothetical protein DPMN_105710 [Dreissena polymorpha]|uniref:Uncharacterized protein n=1 Tax=Dreissena polymorpha TaxID=45954 RepID=A0A9D4QHQ3_DREPO|nr:hypothetical protein DPMN_105710 [Dreissena polymorpha]
MSGKKGGQSTFAIHIDEGLEQLSVKIKRATQIKLMEVLNEGQRQAEERHEMFQQMPTITQQQQQQSPQSSQSSHNVSRTKLHQLAVPPELCPRVTRSSLHHHSSRPNRCLVNSPPVSGALKTINT